MRRRFQILALAVGALVALGASSANAAETQVFQSSFDGTGSSHGRFSTGNLGEIAVDQQSGAVYVADPGKEVVDKFDASGQPTPFSALGTTAISQPKVSSVSVDNSPTATQGSFYMASASGLSIPEVAKYEP